jgi:hypothetical protein
MNYSYAVLCQSDDEADDEDNDDEHRMTPSDVEEANELLATNGLIDYTVEGRKDARKRSLARKKKRSWLKRRLPRRKRMTN